MANSKSEHNNKTIPLEELKEMEGEPVWLEYDDENYYSCWDICRGYEWRSTDVRDYPWRSTNVSDWIAFVKNDSLPIEEYGKTWWAYHTKQTPVEQGGRRGKLSMELENDGIAKVSVTLSGAENLKKVSSTIETTVEETVVSFGDEEKTKDWPQMLAMYMKDLKSGAIDISTPLPEGLIDNMKENLTEEKVDEFENALKSSNT